MFVDRDNKTKLVPASFYYFLEGIWVIRPQAIISGSRPPASKKF